MEISYMLSELRMKNQILTHRLHSLGATAEDEH